MLISFDIIDIVIMIVMVKFFCYIIGLEEEMLNKIVIFLIFFCFFIDLIVGVFYE